MGVRLRKLNTIEEFAPPRKILEPTTTTIRGPFSFSSLPGKVDQRKGGINPTWVLHLFFDLLLLFFFLFYSSLIAEKAWAMEHNDPDLGLHLGMPEVEGEDGLSPVERRIRTRFSIYEPDRDVPIEDIHTIVQLKSEIINRMAELKPHRFWAEQRNRLIAESILTPKGPE